MNALRKPSFRKTIHSTRYLILAVILAGIWAGILTQAEQSVFTRVPMLDEVYYLDRAAAISADGPFSDEPFFMSPLYPRLIEKLALDCRVPENGVVPAANLRGIRFFQVGCWLTVFFMLRMIAGRMLLTSQIGDKTKRLIAWLPSLLWALYLPAAVYTLSILLEVPITLLCCCIVWILTHLINTPSAEKSPAKSTSHRQHYLNGSVPSALLVLALGLTIGLATLLRGTSLVLVVVAVFVLWRNGQPRQARIVNIAILVFFVGLLLAGPVVHNSKIASRLAPPTLNGGLNAYIGNGPEATGYYTSVFPGDWRRDPAGRVFLAERFEVAEISLAQADSIWAAATIRQVQAAPGRTFLLWCKKVQLFFQPSEIAQLTPVDRWAGQISMLRGLVVPYGLLAIAGLLGMLINRAPNPYIKLLCWVLILLIGSQSVFFVVSRYRLVLVPILALLSAAALTALFENKFYKKRLLFLIPLAALVIPWQSSTINQVWQPLTLANEASRWATIGQAENSRGALLKSAQLYHEATAGHPADPSPWLGAATVQLVLNNNDAAYSCLADGLPHVTDDLKLRKMMVSILIEQGSLAEALIEVRQLLQVYPYDADSLHNCIILLSGSGLVDQALDTAEIFSAEHSEDPRSFVDLGILLARSGQEDQARKVFRDGLNLHPQNAALKTNLNLINK